MFDTEVIYFNLVSKLKHGTVSVPAIYHGENLTFQFVILSLSLSLSLLLSLPSRHCVSHPVHRLGTETVVGGQSYFPLQLPVRGLKLLTISLFSRALVNLLNVLLQLQFA